MVEFDTTRAKLSDVTREFQRSPAGGIGVVCFLVCTGFGEPYIGSREPSKRNGKGGIGLNTWKLANVGRGRKNSPPVAV